MTSKAARQLGLLSKGVRKTMTPKAIEARRNNLVKAREKRWKKANGGT